MQAATCHFTSLLTPGVDQEGQAFIEYVSRGPGLLQLTSH